MISRLWPGLVLASLVTTAPAFSQRMSERPSHVPLPGGLEKNMRPEEALAARLNRLRPDDKATQAEILKLAKKLLGDEKFMESIRGKFSREDAEKLLGKLDGGAGAGLKDDPELQKLLKEGLAGNALNPKDKDLFQRWSGKPSEAQPPGTPPEQKPGPEEKQPPAPPPQESRPASREEPSRTEEWKLDPKTQDWLMRNMDTWAKDIDKWMKSEKSDGWRDFVKDFTRRFDAERSMGPAFMEKAGGLSRYMPRMSNWLPRPRLSSIPTLPRLPLPSRLGMPSVRAGGGSFSGGKVILWLAVGGVVAFLLWRAGGWAERVRQSRASGWRLGPWPVRPDRVTTRGDLVRAFEYLALLCLGPAARTHHHHDLASRIGSQPSLDPDRRRDAAAALAEIYEHARYRPEGDPLPEDEIRRARRELCYLAGVAAA